MKAIFTSPQKEALKTLQQIWPTEEIVLIGASALGCFLDMRWRKTHDLDLTVSLSVEEYSSDLKRLRGGPLIPISRHDGQLLVEFGLTSFPQDQHC